MAEMLETGLRLFDENFGGLLKGRPYLAFGDAGSGKTLLGLQFLDGGISRGEPGLLLTLERPDDLLPQAESLGFDFAPALEDGRLVLLEYDRNATGNILRFGWKPFLEGLRPLAEEAGIRRAVFDPIHPLFAGNTEEGRLRYDLRYLVESLEEWGWTTLFLNERGATQGHPSFYRVFSESCSGVFELQDETEQLTCCKHLFVHKLRHAGGPRRKIPFQVVAGQGIVEVANPAVAPSDALPPAPSVPSNAALPDARPAGPAEAGNSPVAPGSTPRISAPERTRRAVLIADDDPFILQLLSRSLSDEFEVFTAADGLEALTLTTRHRPDVVVLDVFLPTITGFEICRSLRESGLEVPVLFISGGAVGEDDRLRGLLLGANDYIPKPFNIREVTEKIRTASRYRVARDPQSAEPQIEELVQAARGRTVPWDAFLERCGRACANAGRYVAPMGIVDIRWDDLAGTDAIVEALEALTHPEDAVGRPRDGEAFVLLNTQDARATVEYLRNLRRCLLAPGRERSAGVTVSYAVFDPRQEEPWTPERAIDAARAEPRALFLDPLFARADARNGGARPASTARLAIRPETEDEGTAGTGTHG